MQHPVHSHTGMNFPVSGGVTTPSYSMMTDLSATMSIDGAHQRSAAYGLARTGKPDYSSGGKSDLAVLLEKNSCLYRHAVPVMDTLYEQIINTHHMVVLTDATGAILHTLGDADFLEKADRVALSPGVAWSEQSKGTNAIGTAIAEQMPTIIHADQHYLFANNFLTCSAAPIFDPQARLIGVLDVTGDQHHFHRHTMALVRMSAQMIENQLFSASFGDGIKLHFHSRPEFIGTLMEGILCFSQDGRFLGASRSAMFQLGLSMAGLQTHTFSSLFGLSFASVMDHFRQTMPGLLPLCLPNGVKVFAKCNDVQPVKSGMASALHTDGSILRQAAVVPSSLPSLNALDTGDPQMAGAIARLRKIIGKGIPLMITGETGTGKEWLAQAIHNESPRRHSPFIALNCASIPEALIESELFGYEDGAFTGARKKGSVGKILQADGGTLFLDEIGDMPLHLQARLLRVLQERTVMPLGAGKIIPVDIEVICATNRQLKDMIAQQTFREDLYYRLNGLVVKLPALRERSDLDTIVARILNAASAGHDVPYHLASEVMQLFRSHHWPGNFRQLYNLLRTAMLMADRDGEIRREHLPEDFLEDLERQESGDVAATTNIAESERLLIQKALANHAGNVSAAARSLGISRNTIYRKLNTA